MAGAIRPIRACQSPPPSVGGTRGGSVELWVGPSRVRSIYKHKLISQHERLRELLPQGQRRTRRSGEFLLRIPRLRAALAPRASARDRRDLRRPKELIAVQPVADIDDKIHR